MFRHHSIYQLACKSGKITKQILKDWFVEVYLHTAGSHLVLIVDALMLYRNREKIDENIPPNTNYTIENLKAGTTSFIQPLDIYFFRFYKTYFQRLSDHINYHHPETLFQSFIPLYKINSVLDALMVFYNIHGSSVDIF